MFQHKGFEIAVDQDMKFVVSGDDVPGCFETGEAAKDAIDRVLAAERKRDQEKMSLPVIADVSSCYGGPTKHIKTQIVGIHGGTGMALVADKAAKEASGFYPDVPWIEKALTTLVALRRETRQLERATDDYRITSRPCGYRRPDDITKALATLRQLHETATTAACKTTLEAELKKLDEKKIK